MELVDIVNVLMRWTHIASMTVIVGGMLLFAVGFGDGDQAASDRAAAGYRPFFLTALVLILLSGIYNFLRKTGLTPTYHAVFGIKILLVLHVLAAGYLAMRPGNPKRRRQALGASITAFMILALSAVLRRLSM